MDEFLKEIHTHFFKQWIGMQKDERYHMKIIKQPKETIIIETNYGYGEVVFNVLSIIELKVVNKTNDEVEFYLHFQM